MRKGRGKRREGHCIINVEINSSLSSLSPLSPLSLFSLSSLPPFQEDHDDACFNCGQGGEVLLCDRCDRVFHLRCLSVGRERERWREFLFRLVSYIYLSLTASLLSSLPLSLCLSLLLLPPIISFSFFFHPYFPSSVPSLF